MEFQIVECAIDRSSHSKTSDYGKENEHLDGVSEILGKADSEVEKHSDRYDECVKSNAPKLNEAYEAYASVQKKANLCSNLFRFAFLAMILCLLGINDQNRAVANITSVLFLVLLVAFVVLVVYANVLHKKADRAYRTYSGIETDALRSLIKIEDQLKATMKRYYDDIDAIFLASLEPTERQVLLLRREQAASEERERQRDEKMIALQAQSVEMQAQNQRLQQELVGQQKELLNIERERERRYSS